ncbi:hypothetical protein PNEG_00561 [Pneumocystis murina B123]|uniref:Uncharacterized protein n=1 Tax=Pneumocystis murina (strain B123) TaxID=1069680 RepID=M7NS21_PNEMU|nr:hypothetical protein PNEG_00561 [Pneumocystis murina B123]EMR11553.1 hypothetical protein PNEG_00561 [Pneumocystis murina B123]
MINSIISTFPPFKTISFNLPYTSTIKDLENYLSALFPPGNYLLSHLSGKLVYPEDTLASLLDRYKYPNNAKVCMFRYVPKVFGGKGGFGSQLRAAGGRMSSRKKRGEEENKSSCRDLNGRRIRTINEKKALIKYLETAPIRKREILEERKQKLEAIIDAEPLSKRIKFEDNEFLEKSEIIIDDVKNAVKLAMLKKSRHISQDSLTNRFNKKSQSLNSNSKENSNPMYSAISCSLADKINKRFNKWDQDNSLSDNEDDIHETNQYENESTKGN